MRRAITNRSESLFQAALRDHANAHYGGQVPFAEKIGMSLYTLNRIIKGTRQASESNLELFSAEIGMPAESLQMLAEVSVQDACQLVLSQAQDRSRAPEVTATIPQQRTEELPAEAQQVIQS